LADSTRIAAALLFADPCSPPKRLASYAHHAERSAAQARSTVTVSSRIRSRLEVGTCSYPKSSSSLLLTC
jgi:hypothetical protein